MNLDLQSNENIFKEIHNFGFTLLLLKRISSKENGVVDLNLLYHLNDNSQVVGKK